uniref:Necrosis inducing protein NPP1 n=2 Tax=Bursaphelenchus xylophilus TaxID=6326 RepID=A0A1I7SKP5_BURXY
RYKIRAGLYTNWYDYEQITGNSKEIPNVDVDIWYWHVNSPGPGGEQSPEHSDYRQFGPFSGPAAIKQFAIRMKTCDVDNNWISIRP